MIKHNPISSIQAFYTIGSFSYRTAHNSTTMNLILITITIITLVARQSSCSVINEPNQPEKLTLNQLFEELSNNSSQIKIIQKLQNFSSIQNFDCIKDKLKLSETGEKELSNIETKFLLAKAATACLDQSENEFLKIHLNKFLEIFASSLDHDDIQCTKFALRKLNQDSKFVENFDENSMTDEKQEECEERVTRDKSGLQKDLNKIKIEDISKFTCISLNADTIYKYMCTFTLVAVESDEQLKDSEMDKLIDAIVKKSDEIFECRINNLSNLGVNL